MIDLTLPLRLKGYRFPRSVIAYAVWSYYRFNLSLRDVEDLLAARGVTVSYETIRAWVDCFGPQMASQIRCDRPPVGDRWHIDEMMITIGGEAHWLWRAVDNWGDVLETLVQKRRDATAAWRFLRKLMRRWGQPRVVVTDKLRSYNVALRSDCPSTNHRSPIAQAIEQPDRSVTPPYQATRKDHGSVQIPGSCPEISRDPRPDHHAVPPKTPPPLRPISPPRHNRRIFVLDRLCRQSDRMIGQVSVRSHIFQST